MKTSSLHRGGLATAAVTLICSGCAGSGASGVQGIYASRNGSSGSAESGETLTLQSDGRMEFKVMNMTTVGTYEIHGSQLKLLMAGETHTLAIDSRGCLRGGTLLGDFCKEGVEPAMAASTPAKAAPPLPGENSGNVLSGTWRSQGAAAGIELAFHVDGRVNLTLPGASARNERVMATYAINGDQISINAGGPPLRVQRKGDTLEMNINGKTVTLKEAP
jgi:hypothetical protein